MKITVNNRSIARNGREDAPQCEDVKEETQRFFFDLCTRLPFALGAEFIRTVEVLRVVFCAGPNRTYTPTLVFVWSNPAGEAKEDLKVEFTSGWHDPDMTRFAQLIDYVQKRVMEQLKEVLRVARGRFSALENIFDSTCMTTPTFEQIIADLQSPRKVG